jgi:hypothetical protein
LSIIGSGVRNIFKILGCHERNDTTQKSIGKAKFTSTEGCIPESLGSKHTGQQVCWGFISNAMLSLPCPWMGRFWVHSLHGWLIRKRGLWEQRSLKFQGSNTVLSYQLQNKPGQLAEFFFFPVCPGPAEDNNPFFFFF